MEQNDPECAWSWCSLRSGGDALILVLIPEELSTHTAIWTKGTELINR